MSGPPIALDFSEVNKMIKRMSERNPTRTLHRLLNNFPEGSNCLIEDNGNEISTREIFILIEGYN